MGGRENRGENSAPGSHPQPDVQRSHRSLCILILAFLVFRYLRQPPGESCLSTFQSNLLLPSLVCDGAQVNAASLQAPLLVVYIFPGALSPRTSGIEASQLLYNVHRYVAFKVVLNTARCVQRPQRVTKLAGKLSNFPLVAHPHSSSSVCSLHSFSFPPP